MRTIRVETTDEDKMTLSTNIMVDFDDEQSVEVAFIQVLKFFQRVGMDIPADIESMIRNHRSQKKQKQVLRG